MHRVFTLQQKETHKDLWPVFVSRICLDLIGRKAQPGLCHVRPGAACQPGSLQNTIGKTTNFQDHTRPRPSNVVRTWF